MSLYIQLSALLVLRAFSDISTLRSVFIFHQQMEQKKSQANNARCNEKKFSSKYIINIQKDTGGSERNHKNIIIIITHFFLVEAYFLLLFVA